MKMKRKLLSVILTLAMVAASLRFGAIDAYAASTWYASGTGTETDPYIIKYATNLNGLANAVKDSTDGLAGVYIKLADDLSGNQFSYPIGTKDKPFKGYFDGNGKNLYLNFDIASSQMTNKAYGVFGALDGGAVVQNVVTSGKVMVQNNGDYTWCGGIAGYVTNATVKNCWSSATVSADAWLNAYAGGIVGELASGGNVYNCYAKSTVGATYSPEGTNKSAGGLVGYLNGGTAYNGYADGTLNCTGHKGGVVGWLSAGSAKALYCKTANESYNTLGSATSMTEATMKAAEGSASSLVSTLNAIAKTPTGTGNQFRMWYADGTNFPEFGQMEIEISFDENGGSGTMGDVNVTAYTFNGAKAVLPACTFEAPSEKVFAGWAIGDAASEIVKLAGETHTFTEATTLYATWDTPFYVQMPVYNVAGDPASGIKEWQQVSLSNRTSVYSADTTWGETGKSTVYVADEDVEINNSVEVKGNVTLILCDGVEVVVDASTTNDKAGIRVSGDGNSLVICAQSEGTGKLTVTAGQDGAGIGGDNGETGGNITINGGTVEAATVGGFGAGIGGGKDKSGSNITINDGTVIATGGTYGAGIGGGDGGKGSLITVNGGTVSATGGTNGAGIGGGQCADGSDIAINGGKIIATGNTDAAGIGGGFRNSGTGITITDGEVDATSEGDGAGIGGGMYGSGSDITIKDGKVHAVSEFSGAGIGGGYGKVELPSATEGDTKLSTIMPQAAEGKNITIEGGEVVAVSIHGGAGIGGGAYGEGKDITVKDGTVDAFGGDLEIQDTDDLDEDADTTEYIFICGSGIGGGAVAIGENISFEGGTVNAKGGIAGSEEDTAAGDGIGNGSHATGSSEIFVAAELALIDGATEEPIAHTDGEDVAEKVLGFREVLVKAPENFTVLFDLGGKGNDFEQQVASGSCAVRPAKPTYKGWTFKGWYQDLENDVRWIFKGEDGAKKFKITEDTTIYAKWEKNVGPKPDPEKPEEEQEEREKPEPLPVKTGSAGDPVTGGIWNMGPGGVWTYRTNGLFRNTWGYIALENGRIGWFYFDKNGMMLSGWQQIDGKWYYFNEAHDGTYGMMLANTTTPDGYKVGADGAWIQ